MAILMFVARIHHLTSSINRHQERLMEITRRISDMQDYAATIAKGSLTLDDIASAPSSMFGRLLAFSQYSDARAAMMRDAQFNDPGFQAALTMQTQNMAPEILPQYTKWIQDNMYAQARDQVSKEEARMLNLEEKKLTQEKEKLEALIKMEEADLESAKKARDKGIEQMAPKYVA